MEMEHQGGLHQDENIQEKPFKAAGSSRLTKVKNIVADTLHNLADTLNDKSPDQEDPSVFTRYKRTSAAWLEQAAGRLRLLEPEALDPGVKNYILRNPGPSLLIAGTTGFLLGAIWKRKWTP